MRTIPVTLPDDVATEVERLAASRGMSADAYLRLSVEEKLARDEEFQSAAGYVLEKNAELYRRLS